MRWMPLILLLSSCSPMPGNFGLIDGVTRVHSLDEMEVVEHPGGLIETASACNLMYWDRGELLGVILSAGCSLGCSLVSGPAVAHTHTVDPPNTNTGGATNTENRPLFLSCLYIIKVLA